MYLSFNVAKETNEMYIFVYNPYNNSSPPSSFNFDLSTC